MLGPARGRKSSAPAKGKGTTKGAAKGAGHTHARAEATTPTAAEAGVLDLQKWAGNRRVAAMLTVSRQPVDVKAPPATDPKFDKTKFVNAGVRFELDYTPNGPMPVKGDVTVTLRVHIDFKDFTRADMRKEPFRSHRFTRAQLRDFRWTADEKTKFGTDFQSSVALGWSRKHELMTKDPAFAEHRGVVDVKVDLVDADKAHNTMTALKVPQGKAGETPPPRFRSFVQGDTSTLDIRDVSEPETSTVRDRALVDQVQGFANNSAELTPDIKSAIAGIGATIKRKGIQLGAKVAADGTKHDLELFTVGRATSKGSTTYNKKLAEERGNAVLAELNSQVGWGAQGRTLSAGAKNTTEEEKFRRVDVVISDLGEGGTHDVTQNTAAHEAGHMFGLGDEYVEEDATDAGSKKFMGDKPTHYGDVEAQLGTDAADEMVDQDSGSIMSVGSDVKRGHYVPFVKSMEAATSKDWTVA
jgi:outer membrane protein OmpA-like peptidoglycan-associated protein